MFFFSLLPTDLQIWVIHAWLLSGSEGSSQMRTTSALDVAVCSHRIRASLLELFKHIPPFLDSPVYFGQRLKAVGGYLRWISSRKLAVQSLSLGGQHIQNLMMIEMVTGNRAWMRSIALNSLQSLSVQSSDRFDFCWLLKVCPNLTAFAFKTPSLEAFHVAILALEKAKLPRLTNLDLALRQSTLNDGVDLRGLAKVLAVNGQALTSLRLAGALHSLALLQAIAQHCPRLCTIDICGSGLPADSIITLGNAVTQLKAISLWYMDADETFITSISQGLAHTQVKSFHLSTTSTFTSGAICARLLAANPHMDVLEIDAFRYDRLSQGLSMSLFKVIAADLQTILSAVPIAKLSVVYLPSDEVVTILGGIGSTLMELSLTFVSEQQRLVALLSKCSNLTSLRVGYEAVFNSAIIAVVSKHLKYVEIEGCIQSFDMLTLLLNCNGLTTVKLGEMPSISTSMLLAIFGSGTVTTLSWRRRFLMPTEEGALTSFRKWIKDKQRLPIPRMLVFDSNGVFELGN